MPTELQASPCQASVLSSRLPSSFISLRRVQAAGVRQMNFPLPSRATNPPLNWSSSSESDVENDGGASSAICSSNFVEIIEPLSKLNIDEGNQAKAIVSNHIPAEQSPVVSSEEFRNAQALMPDNNVDGCIHWRSVLSNIEVWYGSYRSNMWKPRFLCHVEGGKVEGMNNPCPGSRDKSSPKDVIWKTIPHRLFFTRCRILTWGKGGVAFLHSENHDVIKHDMDLLIMIQRPEDPPAVHNNQKSIH